MNPDELKQRTKLFALRVLKLVEALPRNVQVGLSPGSWLGPERRLDRTTALHVEADREQSS